MNAVIDGIMERTRTVLAVLVVALISGLISYFTIPKEASPDIPIPFVFVNLVQEGISPEDGERLLVRPMEVELQSVEGLKEMRSYAAQGAAGIILEFDVNFDPDQALIDVREKVDLARNELPSDAEEPTVSEFNLSLQPILSVVLSGDVPERALLRTALRLEDDIEALSGVLEVDVRGSREELLEVIIDPAALESYDVTPNELIAAVSQNNRLVAAGQLETGEGTFKVKVPGLFETATDVYGIVIRQSGDSIVTLADVADIRRTFKDRSGYARFNGERAFVLDVKKRIGENIIETTDQVKALIERQRPQFPPGIEASVVNEQSTWIEDNLTQLEGAIITAISLVMIVVVAALGLRSGLLVGVAIPSSFLIGFLLLNLMGLTLNNMVMFGLVLSVGILVDGAIVVTEYADRKMAEGQAKREAYALAAKRMFWPITSSTLTTLAAFFPMLFWPGIPGKFMEQLPLTLIFILAASHMVALVFLPVLGSVFGGSPRTNDETLKSLAASEHGNIRDLKGFTGRYIRIAAWSARHPGAMIGIVGSGLFAIIFATMANPPGVEFFVEIDPPQASANVSARGNMSADQARNLVIEVEERLRGLDGVKSLYTTTTTPNNTRGGGDTANDLIGSVRMEFEDWEVRRPGKEIIAEARERVQGIPGIYVEVQQPDEGPEQGKDIQVEIKGFGVGPDQLYTAAGVVRQWLEEYDGVIEAEDTRPLPGIEWELRPDREAAGRFNADITTIGAMVQLVTNGIFIGTYRPDDAEDEVDIRVRFPEGERSLDQLDRLRVRTSEGLIPISNFITRSPKPQVSQIDRVDADRIVEVKANVDRSQGILPNQVLTDMRDWLETGPLPDGTRVEIGGSDEEQQESQNFLAGAMLSALFLMAVILLTQFNSFYHTFLILSTVVLSTVGVLFGILVTGQNFSVIMTGVGIVALAGIVVNNNIVLIDTYQRLRSIDQYPPLEAIVRTGAQRLRPVLLTTITTMAGLMPMVFKLNIDFFNRTVTFGGPISDWWVQLSTAVVFGLGFATILTLILTPAMLAAPWVWFRRNAVKDELIRLSGRTDEGTPPPSRPGRSFGTQPAE